MRPLWWVLGTTLAISLVAWVGVFSLFVRRERLDRILLLLVALAAGSLVGGAFFHLLPRALAESDQDDVVFILVVVGFCVFYVLEAFVHWHHHHETVHERDAVTTLVLVSDAVHNFVDGLVIAGAFLVGPPVGLATALAIALHEIPQEIGDFGVLVYGGYEPRQALVLNYLTQVTVVLGGVVGIVVGSAVASVPWLLLAFASGSFLYIASSDLVPEIKRDTSLRRSLRNFGVFVAGICLLYGVTFVEALLG
ncbi:ZIP family metal transporter [Haloarchaeobius sp. DFWS5]|uniref:ZIP family metal transporter n=1 Tax=Haloarchaeobius sp. DFWS5 TaxID=3446114 RepID=UPI003EB7FB66